MDKIIENINLPIARAEYIEVEKNVHLHITDAGEGRTICINSRLAVE